MPSVQQIFNSYSLTRKAMLMLIHHKWISLYLLVFSFASFILFLYGFFPIKYHAGKVTSWNDLPMSINGTSVDGQELYNQGDKRVVLMVIDALRYDFVTEEYMPFTAQLLKNGSACIHIAMAEPPTVTMPRIKSPERKRDKAQWRRTINFWRDIFAMMTGSVSTFADVALNFGAPAVRGDSVVRAAAERGRTTVLYGDDTWLRLFPELWSRAEGTTSFYVSDYTEVDNNVTRNLDAELTPDPKTGLPPFEFMVLHYLGLDHIGHLEGPRSPKIKPKLIEMDNIVKKIHTAMQAWNVGGAILVCGDHGMRDSGGHGGASPAELLVPLVVAHAKDFTCPHHWLSPPIVAQVDVAPTLSALLRVQLPGDNTGRVLHSVLPAPNPANAAQRLYMLYYNARHNAEALQNTLGSAEAKDKECYKQYERAVRQHQEWLSGGSERAARAAERGYEEALDQMAKYLAQSTVNFDIFAIVLAIFMLFMSLTSLLLVSMHSFQGRECRTAWICGRGVGVGAGMLVAVAVMWLCGAALLVLACAISETESLMCKPKPLWLSVMFFVLCIIVFNFFIIKVGSESGSRLSIFKDTSFVDYYLMIGTFLHSLTFVATSFIEEEHQTWYFYWNTLMMLVFVRTLGMLVRYLKMKWEGATEIQEKPQLKADMSILGADLLPKWLLLICLHRFLRTLNQTGDRWAFLPDTADWLNEPENKHILETYMFVGTTITVIICLQNLQTTRNPLHINSFLTVFAYACILCYRHSTSTLSLPFSMPKSDTVIEVQIFWCILVAQLIMEIWAFKRKNKTIHIKKDDDIYQSEGTDISYLSNQNNTFAMGHMENDTESDDIAKLELVMSLSHIVLNNMMLTFVLLMRAHNVILVPSVYYTSRLTSRCLAHDRPHRAVSVLTETLVHFWIGSLFFFYQGNSNSLASVDLGAGYVGLRAYAPVSVALRMGAHAYAAPALAGMSLFTRLTLLAHDWPTYVKSMRQCMNVLALTRVFELCVYACVAAGFRHHLFVWTVFSPKLLYDFTATAFSIAALFTIFLIYCVTWAVNPTTEVTRDKTVKTKL